jgi:hypothetical protein
MVASLFLRRLVFAFNYLVQVEIRKSESFVLVLFRKWWFLIYSSEKRYQQRRVGVIGASLMNRINLNTLKGLWAHSFTFTLEVI